MTEITEKPEIAVDPMQDLCGYHLRQLSAVSMALLANTLSKYDITPTAASVLLVIAENPETRQSAVGRHLSIRRANIAPIIAALEAGGHLKRVRIDGRSHGLICTRSGTALAGRVRAAFEAHESRLFGSLPKKDRQKLTRLFQQIRLDLLSQGNLA